jgi:hypothetical protein
VTIEARYTSGGRTMPRFAASGTGHLIDGEEVGGSAGGIG